MIGVLSELCFLACFAAFFSFGVLVGCFFVSLLVSFALPMTFLLVIASIVLGLLQCSPITCPKPVSYNYIVG